MNLSRAFLSRKAVLDSSYVRLENAEYAKRPLRCVLAVFCVFLLGTGFASAQQYFDGADTTADNIVDGGSGVWDTTTSNWTTANGSANSLWASGDAIFGLSGTGLYTVSLAAVPLSTTGLTFKSGGYTLTGNSLELALTPNINVIQGQATIASLLTGTTGFTKIGGGKLTLTGNNTGLSGGVILSSGILEASTSANALGGSGNSLNLGGGILQLTGATGLAFGNNTTVSGDSTILLDRGSAGAGVTHTLGTLNMGSQTLTVLAGGATTSGVAGLTFGATTLSSGTSILNVSSRVGGGNTTLTLGSIDGTGNLVKAGNGNLVISGTVGSGIGSFTQYNPGAYSNTVTSLGTTTFSDANSSTGAFKVYGGTVVLTGSNTAIASTDVQLLGGNLQLGNAINETNINRFTGTPAFTMGGGRINLMQPAAGTVTENLGSLTLKPGSSGMTITGGASGNYILSFTDFASRDVGSVLSFPNSNNFSVQFGTTAPVLTGGIIGGWAVRGSNWATVSGAGVNVSSATFDSTDINALSGDNNIDQSLSAGTVTLTSSETINSLRLGGAGVSAAPVLDLNGNTLTLTTGGLMANLSTSQAAYIKNGIITAGTAAGAELFLIDVGNSTGRYGVGAVIADNGSGSVNLVRGSDAGGVLALSGLNTYTGKTVIGARNDILGFASTGASGSGPTSYVTVLTERQLGAIPTTATADKLVLNNGALRFVDIASFADERGITLGGMGGTLDFNSSASYSLVLSANITGTGPLYIYGGGSGNNITLSGSNTFDGTVNHVNTSGVLNFTTIANIGQPSSLGQPTNRANGLIRTGANNGSLVFVGIGDQSTDRDFAALEGTGGSGIRASGAGSLTINGDVYIGPASGNTFPTNFGGSGVGILNGDILQPNSTVAAILAKQDSGTWRFTGQSTYSGTTSVIGGVLEFTTIGNVGSGPSSLGAPTTAANGALNIGGNSVAFRFVGDTDQTSDRQIRLGNTLNAQSNFEASGSNGAVIRLTGGVINSQSSGTQLFGFGGTGIGVESGVIANGSGTALTSVAKEGTGTWTLNPSSVNTYTGATAVRGGTLVLDYSNLATPTNLINSASALTLGGGALKLLGKSGATTAQTLGAVSLTASTGSEITLDANGGTSLGLTTGVWTRNTGSTLEIKTSGNSTLTANPALTNGLLPYATFNGVDFATVDSGTLAAFNGYTGALPTSGGASTDTYTLTGAQTQTGNSSFGALKISATTDGESLDLGSSNITNSTTLAILYDGGGTNGYSYAIDATTGRIGISGQELIAHVAGGTLTISATLGNGTSAFTKAGDGTLILSKENTYTGQTNVNRGTLQAGLTNAFSPNSVANVNLGTTLALNGFSNQVSALVGAGTVTNGGVSDATLTFGNNLNGASSNLLFAGALVDGTNGGKLNITKVGSGVAILGGVNTFSGDVTVSEGLLSVRNLTNAGVAGSLGTGNSITLGSASRQGALGTTAFNSATDRVITLANDGVGVLDIFGSFVSGNFTLSSGGAQTLFGSTALFQGAINGDGELGKTGLGNAILAGNNTYTGKTTVVNGLLQFANANAVGGGTSANIKVLSDASVSTGYAMDQAFLNRLDPSSTGVLALGANTSNNLDMSNLPNVSLGAAGNYSLMGTLTPAGGTYRLGGGIGTLFIQNANTLSGTAGLIVSPNNNYQGSVVISDSQSYSGPTTVKGTIYRTMPLIGNVAVSPATLILAGGGAGIANTSGITLGNQGTLRMVASAGDGPTDKLGTAPITMNGGSLQYRNDGSSTDFAQTIGAVTFSQGQNTIFTSPAVSGATSVLTLSSSLARNNYATVDFGTTNTTTNQIMVSDTSTPLGPWATYGNGNGFAEYNGQNIVQALETPASGTFDSNVTKFTMTGGSTVTLGSGTASADTIRVSSGSSTATTIAMGVDTVLEVNAFMGFQSTNNQFNVGNLAGQGTLVPAAGTDIYFYQNSSSAITVNANINAPGGAVIRGGLNSPSADKALTLSGSNTFDTLVMNSTGQTLISSTKALPANAAIIMNAGLLGLNTGTYSNPITVNGDATMAGFTGNNNWTHTGNISLNNGATLHLTAQGTRRLEGAISGDGGLFFGNINNGDYVIAGNADNTFTGPTWFYGGVDASNTDPKLTLAKTNAIAISGDIYLGWFTNNSTSNANSASRNERLILGGSGDNQIADSSVIYFRGGSLADAGKWEMNTRSETIAGIQSMMTGDGLIVNGANVTGTSTLTLAPQAGKTYAFSGLIANDTGSAVGKLAVVVNGSGTQSLDGPNRYTGGTTVAAGTLLVNNKTGSATGTGSVTVDAGATLGGSGIISGAVTVSGTLAPGNSVGTLTIGNNVTLGSGGTLKIEVDGGANTIDLLAITGDLDLGGVADALTISLLNSAPTTNLILATYTGTLNGTFDTVSGLPIGFSIDYGTLNANAITLVIPEPGTWAMLLGGAGVLALFRRRSFRR